MTTVILWYICHHDIKIIFGFTTKLFSLSTFMPGSRRWEYLKVILQWNNSNKCEDKTLMMFVQNYFWSIRSNKKKLFETFTTNNRVKRIRNFCELRSVGFFISFEFFLSRNFLLNISLQNKLTKVLFYSFRHSQDTVHKWLHAFRWRWCPSKCDVYRFLVWKFGHFCVRMGGGGVSKIPLNSVTTFMNGPNKYLSTFSNDFYFWCCIEMWRCYGNKIEMIWWTADWFNTQKRKTAKSLHPRAKFCCNSMKSITIVVYLISSI